MKAMLQELDPRGGALRRLTDGLRLAYLVAAAVATFLDPASMALLASLAGAWGARWLRLPAPFDLGVVVAMFLTGWSTTLGLYDWFGLYDRLVHFSVIAGLAPAAYLALVGWGLVPPLGENLAQRRRRIGFVILVATVGGAIGAWWEVFEYAADRWLGATLAHGSTDTIGDLVADTVGAAAGGLAALRWLRRRPTPNPPAPR